MLSAASSSEADLTRHAVAGDRDAFAALVAAYDDDLIRVCFVITQDPTVARDVVQEAWSTAWARRWQLRDPERFQAWIVAIACNRARRERRRRFQRARREEPLESSVPAGAEPRLNDPDLAAALSRLAPEDRQLIALKYVMGWSSAEVAKVLGLSPSGARVRLSRAIGRLRRDLS